MRVATRIECDSDGYRWNVLAEDDSQAGLFKLRTAVECTFPGVQISSAVTVRSGLCFALAGYRGEHKLATLDTDAFNDLVGKFDPLGKVAAAGPFEVQAMLSFEPTKDFCDQLHALMRPGISRVMKSSLHDHLLSITVDDLDGDSEHALTAVDVDVELARLLCCCHSA